jgi:hypothetical protein
MALSTGITETVFPAVGKGMPDVISYLDEVPWSTAADVKPMKKSVMTESLTWPGYLPSGLYNPTTPYLFFSWEADDMEGELDTTINATDLTVESEELQLAGMRPIVYINGPVDVSAGVGNQIPQQLSTSLGPFMMIDDEIIRYENPRTSLIDAWTGIFYYYEWQPYFTIPSVSDRGMFGTTATSHLAGATIRELIVGYITGIEYSSNSEMVTIRTSIMKEAWRSEVGYYYPLPDQNQVPYTYSNNFYSSADPYAFSVPRKQISAMGLGQ